MLLAGLQGSGKTTAAGKLACWYKRQEGRNPLLVGADLQRPAAVEQLRVLGDQAGVPVFSEPSDPVTVAKKGLEEAVRLGRDVLIVDTAGRLSIDAELMDEVRRISATVEPHYTFLVIDAMTGQDAVATAEAFHQTLALDGVILTKVDGDARGGAALSVKEVVGRPIVFTSTGEKLGDFDQFYPDRMADRILGMGDVLTLIEKAEATVDQAQAEAAMSRLQQGRFTLEDFLEQMQQVKKMGPLSGLVGMIPGLPKELRNTEIDDGMMGPIEAIIHSMTPEERQNPSIINGSRRLRIANGSGTSTTEVNALLDRFKQVQAYMRQMAGMPGLGGRMARRAAAEARSPTGRRSGAGRSRSTSERAVEHMAVKLRLMRMGKKKQPVYRVVAADSRSPRDGRFIEILGTYEPRVEPSRIVIDNAKAVRWLRDGAQPTETVARLLTQSGAMEEFNSGRPAARLVSTAGDGARLGAAGRRGRVGRPRAGRRRPGPSGPDVPGPAARRRPGRGQRSTPARPATASSCRCTSPRTTWAR